jgi:hypothetical protein
MIDAHPAHSTASASRDDERATVPLDIAEWLRLAAAPTFGTLRRPLTSLAKPSVCDTVKL